MVERVALPTRTMDLFLVLWLIAMSFVLWTAYLSAQAHKGSLKYHPKRKNKYDNKRRKNFSRATNTRRASRRRVSSIPKNSKEWGELMILVRHDERTAERLVRYAQNCNPGRSNKWALEKALWDLQRDRR